MHTSINVLTLNACAHMHCRMSAIRFIRKEVLGVSQAELASIAETTQTTVSRWEKGESFPDLSHLGRIREAVLSGGQKWNDAYFFSVPEAAE